MNCHHPIYFRLRTFHGDLIQLKYSNYRSEWVCLKCNRKVMSLYLDKLVPSFLF